MNSLIVYFSLAVLSVGIGVALYFLIKTKWSRHNEFDATRDLFI